MAIVKTIGSYDSTKQKSWNTITFILQDNLDPIKTRGWVKYEYPKSNNLSLKNQLEQCGLAAYVSFSPNEYSVRTMEILIHQQLRFISRCLSFTTVAMI